MNRVPHGGGSVRRRSLRSLQRTCNVQTFFRMVSDPLDTPAARSGGSVKFATSVQSGDTVFSANNHNSPPCHVDIRHNDALSVARIGAPAWLSANPARPAPVDATEDVRSRCRHDASLPATSFSDQGSSPIQEPGSLNMWIGGVAQAPPSATQSYPAPTAELARRV